MAFFIVEHSKTKYKSIFFWKRNINLFSKKCFKGQFRNKQNEGLIILFIEFKLGKSKKSVNPKTSLNHHFDAIKIKRSYEVVLMFTKEC